MGRSCGEGGRRHVRWADAFGMLYSRRGLEIYMSAFQRLLRWMVGDEIIWRNIGVMVGGASEICMGLASGDGLV